MSLDFTEAKMLPEAEREQLCRDLLAEFGVTHMRRTAKKELIHSCPLPFGSHKNGDRNPSASLNFKKLVFNCFGCGSSGGLLWFIAACRGEQTDEARAWLEKQTGLGQTVMDLQRLLDVLDAMYQPDAEERAPIPVFSESVLDPWTFPMFHPYLTTGAPEFGIHGRGIPEQTLRHFRVGYAPEYFDGTERIIIPLFWEGKLVGWQARHIGGGDYTDKYRNSPDFPRDQVIFNAPKGRRSLLLTESPSSVLRHYHHQPDMAATFGAEVHDLQLRFIQRYEDLYLWYDNDDAGWKATQHIGEANSRYQNVWVVPSPYAADPADMNDELVAELRAQAIPWAVWSPPTTLIPWKGTDLHAEVRQR